MFFENKIYIKREKIKKVCDEVCAICRSIKIYSINKAYRRVLDVGV